jgi:hypothetical protein
LGAKDGLTLGDAYSLCSTAIDFGLAEAVDLKLLMYATVPKSYFARKRLAGNEARCPISHHAAPSDLRTRLLP